MTTNAPKAGGDGGGDGCDIALNSLKNMSAHKFNKQLTITLLFEGLGQSTHELIGRALITCLREAVETIRPALCSVSCRGRTRRVSACASSACETRESPFALRWTSS